MDDEIYLWIDKELESIKETELYLYFFRQATLNKEEESVDYLSNYNKGIELVLSKNNVIQSIHFWGTEGENHQQYKDKLPLDINFVYSRQQIHSLFGFPDKQGGSHRNLLLGYINVWDKYFLPKHSIRFEYSENENAILMLTIASLNLEKVFNTRLQ